MRMEVSTTTAIRFLPLISHPSQMKMEVQYTFPEGEIISITGLCENTQVYPSEPCYPGCALQNTKLWDSKRFPLLLIKGFHGQIIWEIESK